LRCTGGLLDKALRSTYDLELGGDDYPKENEKEREKEKEKGAGEEGGEEGKGRWSREKDVMMKGLGTLEKETTIFR